MNWGQAIQRARQREATRLLGIARDYAKKHNRKEARRWLTRAHSLVPVTMFQCWELENELYWSKKVELCCPACAQREFMVLGHWCGEPFYVTRRELVDAGNFILCEYCEYPCTESGQEAVCVCGHNWYKHFGDGTCGDKKCDCVKANYVVLPVGKADAREIAKKVGALAEPKPLDRPEDIGQEYLRLKYGEFAHLWGLQPAQKS